MEYISNLKILKEKRKKLRNEASPIENKFWYCLRNKQIQWYKFRRQFSIGNFILDFYCSELRLWIELDGESHVDNEKYDNFREKELLTVWVKIIRYMNWQIISELENVLEDLHIQIEKRKRELLENPSLILPSKREENYN